MTLELGVDLGKSRVWLNSLSVTLLRGFLVRYSLQLERKMPLVPRMLDELVFALPPLKDGKLCDLAAGNGNAVVKIKPAYPRQ